MNINRYLSKVSLFCSVCSFIWLSNLFWKSKKTIIHSIVLDNNLSLLKLWIMLGADVNSNISIIGTPLHIAIESNNFAAAEILISNGANVNTETNLNVTPFYLAVKSHKLKIIELLLTNNVNFSEQVLPFTISLKTLINNDSKLLEIFEKKFFQEYEKQSRLNIERIMVWKKLVTANQLNSKRFDDIKEDILKMMTIEDLKNITADYKKVGIETSKYKVNFLNKKILNEYSEKENYKQINFKTDKKK